MAKSKPPKRKKTTYSKVKTPVRPMWMQALRIATVILLAIFTVMVVAGFVIKYYRLISKHN